MDQRLMERDSFLSLFLFRIYSSEFKLINLLENLLILSTICDAFWTLLLNWATVAIKTHLWNLVARLCSRYCVDKKIFAKTKL